MKNPKKKNKFTCGETRFIQFFVEIMAADKENREKDLLDYLNGEKTLDYDTTSNWNYYNIDAGTVRQYGGFDGVYNKQMDVFLDRRYKTDEFTQCYYLTPGKELCYDNVVYSDLNSFKAVNDYLSERAGDEFIAFYANWLKEYFGKNFDFTVVRKGGDEFHLYNMCKPVCGRTPKSGISRTDIESAFEGAKKELEEKPVTIFVPESSSRPCLLGLEYDYKGTDRSHYLFRYQMKGLQFKFGVGATPSLAYDDACKKKTEAGTPENYIRDNFGDSVKIKIGDSEWLKANDYIFLMIKEPDLTKSIQNKVPLLPRVMTLLKKKGYSIKENVNDDFGKVHTIIIDLNESGSRKKQTRMASLNTIIEILQNSLGSVSASGEGDNTGTMLGRISLEELENIFRLSGIDIKPAGYATP